MELTHQKFCFFSKIPALELPAPFTVLDEFRIVNDADKNWTNARLLEKQGQIKDFSTMGLSKLQQIELMKLLLARKEDLDNVTVEEWFSEGFLNSNFYMFWRTMFSFQNWHSALDMKLYAHGLRYLMDGLSDMTSRVFPKYNQCDSFVRPLMTCWKGQGVNIKYETIVTDLELDVSVEAKTASAIRCHTGGGDHTIELGARDMVFIIAGPIVEDTANTWETVALTCKASPLMGKLKEPMTECTGDERFPEMGCHLGLNDQAEEIINATKDRTALMPYIMSQIMPRASDDRPKVVPNGSINIACLGQFVETNNDFVFTLESFVRTARIGVYSLLGVKKQVPDIYRGQYDICRVLRAARSLNSDEPFLSGGLFRRFLGGTYFENILLLGPDEQPADIHKPSLFEREQRALLDLIEKSETVDGIKGCLQGIVGGLTVAAKSNLF
jgi:myosin-crossreactive antigen